jgi:hypothetical protein
MTQTDQVNPGESYDPLLMSPVKPTSISADERGRRRVKEGFISPETWIVYVCHSEGEWEKRKCL